MHRNRELWNEYRLTWEAFAAALEGWQHAAPEDKARLHAAMEEARAAHAAARDRLAAGISEQADQPARDYELVGSSAA